jgi:hypothetical protein
LGLTRNLAIPLPNKSILGEAGILEAVERMKVWSVEGDVARTVQASAVGVVKNLCRDHGEVLSGKLANIRQ